MSDDYDFTCQKCHGLRARPNTPYHYSGHLCLCDNPQKPAHHEPIEFNAARCDDGILDNANPDATAPAGGENTITFCVEGNEPLMVLRKDGRFTWKGQDVDDVHEVYRRFNEWLGAAIDTDAIAAAHAEERQKLREAYEGKQFFTLHVGEVMTREKMDEIFNVCVNKECDGRADTEARVRAEVWGKAHNAVTESGPNRHPASDATSFFAGVIEGHAMADGVDLTSLAKPE